MAEKRMISKSISVSEKVNQGLSDIFHMLLFSWMIPHYDDFGRMPGSPAKVKALVCPMLPNKKKEDVERALREMNDIGLINWYEINGEKYIQAVNFEEHQTGLHKRTKSKFPEPPEHSRKFPEIPPEGKGTEGNRTEENGTEGNGREMPSPDSDPRKDELLALINKSEIHDFNLHHLDIVYSYIGVVDIEVIETAIKKSFKKHGQYLANTLEGMVVKDGITKKEQVLPKPKVGDPNEKSGIRSERPDGNDKPVTGPVGWLPGKYNKGTVVPMPNVSG